MRYHTTSRISENRKKTPEGFLICLGVPVARAGTLEYVPEELPDDFADDSGAVLVSRDESVVFAPESLAATLESIMREKGFTYADIVTAKRGRSYT